MIVLLSTALLSCTDIITPATTQSVNTPSETHLPTDTAATIPSMLTELDVSSDATVTYDKLLDAIRTYPALKVIRADAATLTSDEYIALCNEKNKSTLELYAKIKYDNVILDLTTEEMAITNATITDKEHFDTLLSYLPSGSKMYLADCNYTNDELAALREKHTRITLAWKLYLGEKWTLRTDDEAFSVMIYNYNYTRMTSENIRVLEYTTNLKALDIGHQAVTDLTSIGKLTELRVLILADNKVSDLTPLSNLKKLEYLELFVNRISDLSPISECTSLIDLNFGWNRSITDISCIYNLDKIERLWLPTTGVASSKRDDIKAAFPNAKIIFEDVDSVSSGWRTHPRYKPMRAMFTNNKYDENFANYK